MPLDQAANETYGLSFKPRASETKAKFTRASATLLANTIAMWIIVPPWPNGLGVGLLIRRLRVRVPQGVLDFQKAEEKGGGEKREEVLELMRKETNPIIGCLL